jgi:copper chaperone NosL
LRIIASRNTQYARYALPVSLALALAFIALSACGGNANTEPVPPTIHYGEDMCEFCGMIVSEERFAAGYITPAGQEHIFDDIGDLVQARLKNPEAAAAIFVHEYDDHIWIKAEIAFYVKSDNLPTPMLSGIAAFASAERARDFAEELNGQVFSFDELLTYYRENPL